MGAVYSGKVCAGFLAHAAAERWQAGSHILILHSGGVPALFAYHDVISRSFPLASSKGLSITKKNRDGLISTSNYPK